MAATIRWRAHCTRAKTAVQAITRDDVRGFYDSYIGPNTMSLVIVGDVTDANAIATASKVFGQWTKAASATRPVANPPVPRPMTIYLRDVPGAATYMYVGNLGPRRTAPDAFAGGDAGRDHGDAVHADAARKALVHVRRPH